MRRAVQRRSSRGSRELENATTRGIAIIGPGRVGQGLGKLLSRTGMQVSFVAARRLQQARKAVKFIGSGRPVRLGAPELLEVSVILLTTSDSALATVARDLAALQADWRGKVILHTCGSLPASVLQPLRRRGAAIGSIHPFQTVPSPSAGVRNLENCFWGIEGDPQALKVARQWVRALRGTSFRLRPSRKTLYHLAAFLVCPTVVTLMAKSARILRRAGVPPAMIRPMLGKFVAETVKSFVEFGERRALTGPAARGDWPTLRRHLVALRRNFPEAIPIYKALVQAMLRLAGQPTFMLR